MDEKYLQKTHMLSEVAGQHPANSIKILLPHWYSPTPHQIKPFTQPPQKSVLRQESINTRQVDMKTLTLNPLCNNYLVLVGNTHEKSSQSKSHKSQAFKTYPLKYLNIMKYLFNFYYDMKLKLLSLLFFSAQKKHQEKLTIQISRQLI